MFSYAFCFVQMTITLVDVNSADNKSEMSFSKPVVRIGREAGESDILFDGAKFPMVSRRHAELRCENGAWLVHDLGSSYGLFLNGQKVGPPQPLAAGNKIQIGTDGPTLLIIWLDAEVTTPASSQPPRVKPVASTPAVVTELPRQQPPKAPES